VHALDHLSPWFDLDTSLFSDTTAVEASVTGEFVLWFDLDVNAIHVPEEQQQLELADGVGSEVSESGDRDVRLEQLPEVTG
jgi:hypothetical protein